MLRAHRARVEAELERLGRLHTLLDHACARADREVGADDVLATIEAMSRVVRQGDARRRSGETSKDSEAQWRKLGDELRACMGRGERPTAPRPRAVARKVHARISEFAGGDRATLEALAHLRRLEPPKDLAGGLRS